MKNNKKSYNNKGKKYQKDEKAVILELFQEGYSKKDIARMLERKIDSIQDVIDEQIRSSIILTDEDYRRIKIILRLIMNFAKHPLSKEVSQDFKSMIENSLMEQGNYTVDEILEFILVDSQLIIEQINLQKLFRNNTKALENRGSLIYFEDYKDEKENSVGYVSSIIGTKERIKILKRWKDNILFK